MTLHVAGWDTDDIDAACEALAEACDEGPYEGSEILDLGEDQVARVLGSAPPADQTRALLRVAELRNRVDPEAEALRRALYDLDAFAYEYAGDD